MKRIYTADNIAEAHIVAGLLKNHGIESHVAGHYLQGGVGDLMASGFADIHVRDEDSEAARAIIDNYERGRRDEERETKPSPTKPSWPYWLLLLTIFLLVVLVNLRSP